MTIHTPASTMVCELGSHRVCPGIVHGLPSVRSVPCQCRCHEREGSEISQIEGDDGEPEGTR